MTIPDWIYDAVFYQIFPDRFANGDPGNDPVNAQAWGAPPTIKGFQGGDLAGIRQRLDYLLDLGINAIYLNPIFLSPSNHRYDTVDYYRIDPKLGSLEDFRQLMDACHRQGVRVILDGVFNHTSRGFFAFNDLLENGPDSPYQQWYHVRRFPLRAYEPGKAQNYAAWWGFKSLPKLNTGSPAVRRYLLDAARYWIEQGADGWRLDVPNEIDDDDFWAEFRQVVHAANPQAYLLGEIWEIWPRWVNDTHFDGLMNYPLRKALLALLSGQANTTEFAGQVENLLSVYPAENTAAMYNLLGSHDIERILTVFGGDSRKVTLAYLFLFAFPGVPAVYYGDEVGIEGGRDPDCRRAFPWSEAHWNTSLRGTIKTLIGARKASLALRHGSFQRLLASEQQSVYAFARSHGEEQVVIAINSSEKPAAVEIPTAGLDLQDGQVLRSLLDSREAVVQAGRLTLRLDPFSGVYLSTSSAARTAS